MKHFSFKKHISPWAIALIFTQLACAQTSSPAFHQKNKTTDLVFEGEVVEQVAGYSEDKLTILTKNIVRARKVFQGNLHDSVYVIVTPGGVIDERFMIYGKALQLNKGDKGLFWAQKGAAPFGSLGTVRPNEYWAIEQSDFLPIGTRHSDENSKEHTFDLFEEVLTLLGKPSFEFPPSASSQIPASVDCSNTSFENWAQISLQNFQITENYTTLECDIVLKAYPPGVRLGHGQMTFTLPKAVFGTNAVNNQSLLIQKGEILADSNYTINYVNLSDSTVVVQINQTDIGGGAYGLSGTFKALLRLKATIINPLLLASLAPEDFNFAGQLEFVCNGRYVPFERITYVSPTGIVPPNFEAPIGIHYAMDRFYYNGNNIISFDIFARTDELSRFRRGVLYIDYDNTTFGSNIANGIFPVAGVLNGNVSISDEDANTLRIEILPTGTSNFIQLGTNLQLLLRYQTFLPNCSLNLGLKWNSQTISPNHTYMEGGTEFQYMPVTTSGEFLNRICACNETSSPDDPVITALSSPSVKAGVGEILTIFGNKFGNGFVEGQCYIEVDNADHSPSNKTKIPAADIISWTNTQIRFYVPSTTIGQTQAPMESGPVKVVNYCGSSNTMNVEVEYAVLNFRPSAPSLAKEVGLAMNTVDEIQFEYYTVGMNTDVITMITEGLNAWRCVHTQIKWRTTVTGTILSNQTPLDKRNIIKAVPGNQVPTAYAAVIIGGYAKNCTSLNGLTYYFDDVDILVNKDINWDLFNPTHRTVFMHELGHAHLLQHASYLSSNDEKILHYSYAVFQGVKPEDRAGGLHVLAAAPSILNGCIGVDVVQQMACTNAIDDQALAKGVKVAPNPFTSDISLIGDETAVSGLVSYRIFDIFGTEVANGSLHMNSPLTDFRDKPSGAYFVSIVLDGEFLVFKVIKQ